MTNYEKFCSLMRKIADLNYASAVLRWDQEVNMPPKGAIFRANQVSTLSGIAHEMFIDEKTGKLLNDIELKEKNNLNFKQKKNIEITLKDYKKNKKYRVSFVEELNKSISEAIQSWHSAKKNNDFNSFAPYLEKLIQLKKKECDIIGYDEHPYDALIDNFEPEMKCSELNSIFTKFKSDLLPFLKEILEKDESLSSHTSKLSKSKQTSNIPSDIKFMYKYYEKNKQWNFGIYLLKQMGYDFNAGRQDISMHPFTTSFGPKDVRVTTRINENNLYEMIWSCIHEGGHALYEQGLPESEYGLPSGTAVSLGIHESQSRLWENNVGRSLAYWKFYYSKLQEIFPENLKNISLEQFYFAINKVRPSLIRINADELTYHFHILIRYEIEKNIFEDKVTINELPELWNSKYKEYLNLDVPDYKNGILQDIHWAHGSFGYFPTYSLGSFYAAQFYAKVEKEIPDLNEKISSGELNILLNWLRENIHKHGRIYTAQELCEKVTGEKLNTKYFLNYAFNKFAPLYKINVKEKIQ